MDIQKEREAFEAWYRKEYDNSVIDDSEFSEILDEYESNYYWVDELNQSWKAWQAAKAQAVPEWISVDDRLPKELEDVIFKYRGVITQGYFFTEQTEDEYSGNYFTGFYWFCENRGDTLEEFHDISHWAPLQKPEQEPAND